MAPGPTPIRRRRGEPNIAPTPTPTPTATPTSTPFPAGVTLNEILPDPQRVDWDQNGVADFVDEWIELYNGSPAPAALGGWAILDDTKAYTLPLGLTIWPQSYLLLYRRETGLSLSDWRDRVTLARPDGSTADQFAYDHEPGADRSFCRRTDGSGAWTNDCEVTPGRANRLLSHSSSGGGSDAASAQPTRSPLTGTIAAARAAPDDTRVTVTGAVTLPPGLYGRNIYLQDATGGIKVYLRSGDYPALAVGDQVRVTGWTRQFHGEIELSVPNPGYLALLGPGSAPAPVHVRTGRVGEAHEGRLIWIAGRVVKFEPQRAHPGRWHRPDADLLPRRAAVAPAVRECRRVLGCAGGGWAICVRGAVGGRVPGDPAVQDRCERRAAGVAGDGRRMIEQSKERSGLQ